LARIVKRTGTENQSHGRIDQGKRVKGSLILRRIDSYIRFGKDALDLIKSALLFLPQGKREAAETKPKAVAPLISLCVS
jgi:hypothetical protein